MIGLGSEVVVEGYDGRVRVMGVSGNGQVFYCAPVYYDPVGRPLVAAARKHIFAVRADEALEPESLATLCCCSCGYSGLVDARTRRWWHESADGEVVLCPECAEARVGVME
jgi:hypothetical protein